MNKTKIKRITSIFMTLALALGMTACNGGETSSESEKGENYILDESATGSRTPAKKGEKPAMLTFDSTVEMRMAAWSVPPHANKGHGIYANNPDYATVENFQIMKDAGFNYAYPTDDFTDEEIEKTLSLTDAVGLKTMVRDHDANGLQAIIAAKLNYEDTMDKILKNEEVIKARLTKFFTHESAVGLYAYDEPSIDHYEAIAAAQDWFLKNFPDKEFLVNLFPTYATDRQLYGDEYDKGYTYKDYVGQLMQKVNPEVLYYDSYPLLRDPFDVPYVIDDWMYNLSIAANASKQYGTPFEIFLQTIGFYENLPLTSYSQYAWQVYTSMAFGVQGIANFCYWTMLQPEEMNNVRDGMVDRDGTKLPAYDYVKEVFDEVKGIQDIYLNYDWTGVYPYQASAVINGQFSLIDSPLTKLANIATVESNEDLLIGQFKNKDGYAYMVTNAVSPYDDVVATATLELKDYHWALVCKKGQREIVELTDSKLTMEIGAGEGYFVIPL